MREDRVGCLAAMAGALGAMTGFVGGLVLLGLAVFAVVVPFGLRGCDIALDSDLAPRNLGVTGQIGGPLSVRSPTCFTAKVQSIQLVSPDGTVLWKADATTAVPVRELLIGLPPTGFVDSVALATPLDDEVTYQVQMLAQKGSSPVVRAQVRFAPVDLAPDQILVDGQLVTPEVFDTTACNDSPRT